MKNQKDNCEEIINSIYNCNELITKVREDILRSGLGTEHEILSLASDCFTAYRQMFEVLSYFHDIKMENIESNFRRVTIE